MEFLPPDIAPLHDAAETPCVPAVCLDPRRRAEDVCPAAFDQMYTPHTVTRLAYDIDRALNDPEAYQLPNIKERTARILSSTKEPRQLIQARILGATAPLFELRSQHETSEAEMHAAYIALAGIAATIKPGSMKSPNIRGAAAEIAIHSLLLRRRRNVPYLTSRREEASQCSVLNNDLGVYDAATGHTGKVPVQIKMQAIKPGKYFNNRVMPVGAAQLFAPMLEKYPQLVNPNETPFMTIFRLIASEASGRLYGKSPSGKVLKALSHTLNKRVDSNRQRFEDAAYAQGVRNVVNSAFANQPGVITRSRFRAFECVQLSNGSYVFFNCITAVRREHASDPNETQYRLSFGLNDLSLASIACTGVLDPAQVTTSVRDDYPATLPQDFLQKLAANKTPLVWNDR